MLSDEIHEGLDGWLFLVGGRNEVIDLYTTEDAFSRNLASEWITLLRRRVTKATELGASYYHLVAPEKLTIYPDYFGTKLRHFSACPSHRFGRAIAETELKGHLIELLPFFQRQRELFKLYWQTDTHWTFHGCYCAYQMLCSYMGIQPNSDLASGTVRSAPLLLDLGSKLEPPIAEIYTYVDFVRNSRRVSANAIVNFKEKNGIDSAYHVGTNVVFVNCDPSAIKKCVVLFGDSFSEYRPHLLTGMLAETFREMHFVWSASIDWDYVARVRPDILVTETAERFMRTVPDDEFDLDAYATRLLYPLQFGIDGKSD